MSKESYILKNLKTIGVTECARKLNISRNHVYKIAKFLNIKLDKKSRCKIRSIAALRFREPLTQEDFESFLKINTPEKAYLLGYFWADGHVEKNLISMSIAAEDMNEVKGVFLKTAKWKIRTQKKKTENTKEIQKIYLCNQRLCGLFREMGFAEKSFTSISKVLFYIPKEFHPYWLRGYFDGDGCVSFLKNGFGSRAFITSSYNQDWSGLETLVRDLEIKYCIRKKNSKFEYLGKMKNGYSSEFIVSRRVDLFKLFNYIYGIHLERFGLKRKYNKFIDIFTRPMKRKLKKNAFMEKQSFSYWN